MRLLVNQVDWIKRESKYSQSKQESDQNHRKLDDLRQRQDPTEKYEKDIYSIVSTQNDEIQKEISVLKSQIQELSDLQNISMVTQKKEGDANELKTKLANLESADVFLQETSRLAMEKTGSLEKTIDQLIKGKLCIEKHQKNSIKNVDQIKRDISAEKLRVN